MSAKNIFDRNSSINDQVFSDSKRERVRLRRCDRHRSSSSGRRRFEKEILAGSTQTVKSTSVLIAEVYNFEEESRRFPAMCTHIESLGLRCIDIGEPLWREYDKSFWQIDLFFVQTFSKEFQYGSYK